MTSRNKTKRIPKDLKQQTAGAIDTLMLNLYELNSVADELVTGLNEQNRTLREDLADQKKYLNALRNLR